MDTNINIATCCLLQYSLLLKFKFKYIVNMCATLGEI